jgi:hypothetical protein
MLGYLVMNQLDSAFAETRTKAERSMRIALRGEGLEVVGDVVCEQCSMVQSTDPGERFNIVVTMKAKVYSSVTREFVIKKYTYTYNIRAA